MANKSELGLPKDALLALDFQERLTSYYSQHVDRFRGDKTEEGIKREAVKATSNLLRYLKVFRGARFCDSVIATEGGKRREYWYFTRDAIELLANMNTRKDLVGVGYVSHTMSYAIWLKNSQLQAIRAVAIEIVEEER